jgi:hypothetical protein
MPTSRIRSLHPRDFEVNHTWLAFRINQRPVAWAEGQFDIFVLQDAASMFLFGTAFAPHGEECPPAKDATRLLNKAWSSRQEWPVEILLVGKPSSKNAFASAARQHGISVRAVAEARASFYIKDVQASFEEYAGPGDADNLSPPEL